MSNNNGRIDDRDRIDNLLASVSDPVQRSILIVLSNISHDLNAQTQATNALTASLEVSTKKQVEMDTMLSKHIVDEEIFLGGIRANTRLLQLIAPVLSVLVLGIGGYVWVNQAQQLGEVVSEVRTIRQVQLVVLERLRQLESK